MSLRSEREEMAQTIHDAFYAMQAGEWPDPNDREPFNAGDMQLASDLQDAGYRRQVEITDAEIEAARSWLTWAPSDRVLRAALEAARNA